MDKIRGERQDGCSHDQRLEKTQRSTSDCFPKHQQERAHWQRAPPAGKAQKVFLKNLPDCSRRLLKNVKCQKNENFMLVREISDYPSLSLIASFNVSAF